LNRACKKRNIPLIFSSTAAIYGNGNGPLNLYAESKLQNEKDISNYAVCLRLFNVYGGNEQHKGRMASVIFKWFNELKESGKIKLFLNSNLYKRDFIFVDDICQVAYNSYKNYIPGIYDVGSGQSVDFETIADEIIRLIGMGTKEYVKMPDDLKKQYQTNTLADIQKIISFGWLNKPKSIIEGICLVKENNIC
jgi:ADP-L-glycero-D-manno-heptose 6-epimerase